MRILTLICFLLLGCAHAGRDAKSDIPSLFPTVERAQSQLTLTACAGIQQAQYINERQENYAYVCRPFTLSSEDTAFVLLDVWDMEGRAQSPKWKRGTALLQAMRKNNFYVVHAPAEIALEYGKYKKFRAEVKKFLGREYCKGSYDFGSSNRQKIYGYGMAWEPNCLGDNPPPFPIPKIFPPMAPDEAREKEFLVFNEDDVRYFFWKHKIKNLVYVGGAVDQCLLRRPIGLNMLTGTDSHFLNMNIFLVEDILSYMPNLTEKASDEDRKDSLLKSLSFVTAKITRSDSFRFEDPPAGKQGREAAPAGKLP